ncbi:MAG: hypothetical protein [Podoviridae sp. ctLUJ1]|nr:MAG: hypothetical protein [Podoviridae sp. ctLUJ1]
MRELLLLILLGVFIDIQIDLAVVDIQHDQNIALNSLKSPSKEVAYCEWDRDDHILKVIKGTQAAKKARATIGEPSDRGGC